MHPVPSLQILLLPLPYLWVQERQGDARVSFLSLQAVLYWRVCHPFLATDLSEDFQTSGPPVIAEIHSQAPGQCGLWVTGGWYALGRCMNPHTHTQSHTVWAESVDDCGMYFLDSSLKSVFVPPSQPQALFCYSLYPAPYAKPQPPPFPADDMSRNSVVIYWFYDLKSPLFCLAGSMKNRHNKEDRKSSVAVHCC